MSKYFARIMFAVHRLSHRSVSIYMNKKFFTTSLTGLLLLAMQASALGQSGPAREQLEQFSLELETLQAHFDQQVVGSNGTMETASSGQVWLSRPQLFRWEYGGDFPEIVVADGSHVWLYDEVLEQVTVRNQTGLSSNSPLIILTDLSRLDEQFEVRELGDDSGMHLLELKARNPNAEFERVLLGLQEGSLLMMAMEDAFGQRTEIHFRDIQRNPVLDAALFQFEPPQNTDVIGELPGTGAE
jgi:outer membrane lipoprotein carrier protein